MREALSGRRQQHRGRQRGSERERGQVSRQEAWPHYRSKAYRCGLPAPDDALREQADPLPVLDEEADLASHDTDVWAIGVSNGETRYGGWRDGDVRELVFEVAGDGHFLDAVNPFARGLFFVGYCSVLAPLLERRLGQERLEDRIVLDYWVVPAGASVHGRYCFENYSHHEVDEPGQSSPGVRGNMSELDS